MDGLDEAIKMKWRKDATKYIFHVCESPPHGHWYGNRNDAYPNGCPCRINIGELADKMKKLEISYKVMKLNNKINIMIKKFRPLINDFEVL